MRIRGFFLFILLVISTTAVADNPFGLPEPNDPDRPGAILLHGGGKITEEVFERFIELAGGKSARIVLVPSAGYDTRDFNSISDFHQQIQNRYFSWFNLKREGRIADITILHTEDPTDSERPTFLRPLTRATGVWFTGGDQGRLNYRYVGDGKDSRYQIELKKVLQRGGVVGGTSAGAAIIPEISTLWSSQDRTDSPLVAKVAHGFGLMNRVIVEQHFDTRIGRFERFLNLLKDEGKLQNWSSCQNAGESMMGVAIDEPGAAEISRASVRTWGPGHVHLFVKHNHGRTMEWHDIQPDQTINVQLNDKAHSYAVSSKD